jgi:uncharacterized membrane protein
MSDFREERRRKKMMGGMGLGWGGFGMFLWPLLLIGLLVWIGYTIGGSSRGPGHEQARAVERRREKGARDA